MYFMSKKSENRVAVDVGGRVIFRFDAVLKDIGLIKGIVFGFHRGIVNYCSGTVLGALGEGRMDALPAVLGMLCGATLYAEMYPVLNTNVLTWGEHGEITLPGITGIDHRPVIGILIVFLSRS